MVPLTFKVIFQHSSFTYTQFWVLGILQGNHICCIKTRHFFNLVAIKHLSGLHFSTYHLHGAADNEWFIGRSVLSEREGSTCVWLRVCKTPCLVLHGRINKSSVFLCVGLWGMCVVCGPLEPSKHLLMLNHCCSQNPLADRLLLTLLRLNVWRNSFWVVIGGKRRAETRRVRGGG